MNKLKRLKMFKINNSSNNSNQNNNNNSNSPKKYNLLLSSLVLPDPCLLLNLELILNFQKITKILKFKLKAQDLPLDKYRVVDQFLKLNQIDPDLNLQGFIYIINKLQYK